LLALPLQLKVFLLTIILGLLTGIVLHLYQIIISKVRLRPISLYVLDFSFWLMLILLIFSILLVINFAEIRAYIFLGLLAGVILYYYWLARAFEKVLGLLASSMIFSIKIVRKILVWPINTMKTILTKKKETEMEPPAEIE
jgi:spore cortex biosynthesis protein YabQ